MNCASNLRWLAAVICIVPLMSSTGTYGKSFDESPAKCTGGHCKDWVECLGVAKPFPDQFYEGLKEFSAQIDEVKNVQAKLRDEYGIQLKHRLLFHWGFNNDPKNSQPLSQKIYECGLSAQKRENLFNYLREQQKQRNGRMITKVEAITGTPKGQARALATILYDVHILGDYDTEDVEPLLDLRKVNFDLKQKGILRMEFKIGQEEFLRALDKAEMSGQSDKQKAKNIINTIEDNLPGLLSKQWHGSFPNGIRLTGKKADNSKGADNMLTRTLNAVKRLLGRQ